MKLSAFYEFHPCCVGQSFAGLNVNKVTSTWMWHRKKITLGERITVLFSFNTRPHTDTHTAVRLALNVLVMGWCFVSATVFLFFSTHHSYLIQFLSAGTQTCCQQHCHHPCLDILEPPENDVLIFLCGRGWTEESGGLSWIIFPFLSVYLFMSFHFASIKSACVFVGAQVHAHLVCCRSLLVTLL